jgi:hypothetical protein
VSEHVSRDTARGFGERIQIELTGVRRTWSTARYGLRRETTRHQAASQFSLLPWHGRDPLRSGAGESSRVSDGRRIDRVEKAARWIGASLANVPTDGRSGKPTPPVQSRVLPGDDAQGSQGYPALGLGGAEGEK